MYLENSLFYCENKDTYPPFKKGLYLEEYFLDYMKKNNLKYDKNGKMYIPILWTNFQIEEWFNGKKNEMQESLNQWLNNNPSENGYFTVVQYDDGPLLNLPNNTTIYGACSGTEILPLIYEDINNTLELIEKKSFNEKNILCSFVGTYTHNVRNILLSKLENKTGFYFSNRGGWSPVVEKNHQENFIRTTVNSKFSLAPRGYGRSSFRFFEIMKLDTIPIYIWDDIEWLPYKDIINYSKFSISININQIDNLPEILSSIDEYKYNCMIEELKKIKKYFELDFMCKYITLQDTYNDIKISLAIPTKNRFDSFLKNYLNYYTKYIDIGLIDEIVICDETGDDYEKINLSYINYIKESKLKIYKNDNVLGVFKNKIKVVSLSSNKFVALIDSDNFADENYFNNVKKYIINNIKNNQNIILAPCVAKTPSNTLNYTKYLNNIITTKNIKYFFQELLFQILLNTGNYVINKNIMVNLKYDNNIMNLISACDVLYTNLLLFQQIDDFEFHIISSKYQHSLHDDSEYIKTNHICNHYRDTVIVPQYYNLEKNN